MASWARAAGVVAWLAFAAAVAGCGGGSGGPADPATSDAVETADAAAPDAAEAGVDAADAAEAGDGTDAVGPDSIPDATPDETPEADVAADPAGEASPDAATDEGPGSGDDAVAPADDAADAAADPAPTDGLPSGLPFAYTRPDAGTPLTDQEVADFTRKVLGFLKQVHYFDHVLYTTYGLDASSGKGEWSFWYTEGFRKEGDRVTFYHGPNPNDGGHNLHDPLSRAIGDSLAASLLVEDPIAGRAAELLCKGMSASMLGMVHDASDPLDHLMSRNVVPAVQQQYLTHDGKKKAVDTSGWWSSYHVWNADRFEYADNPSFGPMWITSLRSKDDVPYIFKLIPILRYAVDRTKSAAIRTACGDTLRLLEAFTADIVDSGFKIRAKDADGKPYIPGETGNADLDYQQKDIASFVHWSEAIPMAECNARRASELIALHRAATQDCGRGEPNTYDDFSYQINSYNKGICQYFHLAHLANALANRDGEAAQVLDGLSERVGLDEALTGAALKDPPGVYRRDMALYLAQSHAWGLPLTSDEARAIQASYGLAIDRLASWPYWDPWAATVPDGDHGSYRPPDCEGQGAAIECWFGDQDLAQVFETCWSPFVNPAGARWVDCDIVRDPSRWDAPP